MTGRAFVTQENRRAHGLGVAVLGLALVLALAGCGSDAPAATAPIEPAITSTSLSTTGAFCRDYTQAYRQWTENTATIGELRDAMKSLLSQYRGSLDAQGAVGLSSGAGELMSELTKALPWADQTRSMVLGDTQLALAHYNANPYARRPAIAGASVYLAPDRLATECHIPVPK